MDNIRGSRPYHHQQNPQFRPQPQSFARYPAPIYGAYPIFQQPQSNGINGQFNYHSLRSNDNNRRGGGGSSGGMRQPYIPNNLIFPASSSSFYSPNKCDYNPPPPPPNFSNNIKYPMGPNQSNQSNSKSNHKKIQEKSAPKKEVKDPKVEEPQPQYRIFKRGDTLPSQSPSPTKQMSEENSGTKPIDGGISWDKDFGPSSDTTKDKENSGSPKRRVKWLDESPNEDQNQAKVPSEPKSFKERLSIFSNRTSVSTIAEIGRYNGLDNLEYKLISESGPPHNPTFTVVLSLGNEKYQGEGSSIKKAQHSAALEAIEKTTLPHPPPRPSHQNFKGSRRAPSQPHPPNSQSQPQLRKPRPNYVLLQLQALADEFNEPLSFTAQPISIIDPFNRVNPSSIVIARVGQREWIGEGGTFNQAKHNASLSALKAMLQVKQERELAKLEKLNMTPAQLEQQSISSEAKSPISIVHEMAMKRGLAVSFDVISEVGPAHQKEFQVECTAGEYKTIGMGGTKQEGKKTSSEAMIEKLKDHPLNVTAISLKNIQRALLNKPKITRKKPITPVVKEVEKQIVSPISRLIQIAHIKKYKEPVFVLIGSSEPSANGETDAERDKAANERRRNRKLKPIFQMEVSVGPHKCQGEGTNKKDAKNAAANAALIEMGYQPTPISEKPVGEREHKDREGKERREKKREPNKSRQNKSNTEKSETIKVKEKVGSPEGKNSSRQIVPGVFLLEKKTESNATSKGETLLAEPNVQQMMIAKNASFLLQDNSFENIKKLEMLAVMFSLNISICDFPKKNEYLSVVTLATDSTQETKIGVAHGVGSTLEEAQNSAALKILEECAEIGTEGEVKSTTSTT